MNRKPYKFFLPITAFTTDNGISLVVTFQFMSMYTRDNQQRAATIAAFYLSDSDNNIIAGPWSGVAIRNPKDELDWAVGQQYALRRAIDAGYYSHFNYRKYITRKQFSDEIRRSLFEAASEKGLWYP